MATHFDFLAQARPASLFKLLEKLSMGDAAIVLTGLPKSLAIQALAFYPEEIQELIKPAMVDARMVSDQFRAKTAQKIRSMLETAKNAKNAKNAKAGSTPNQAAVPPVPSAPMGPASAAFVANNPPKNGGGVDAGDVPHFSGMDPSASVLTGSVPDEFPKEPPARQFTPIASKFTSPMMTARKRAGVGQAGGPGQGQGQGPGQGQQPSGPPADISSGAAGDVANGHASPPARANPKAGPGMNLKGKTNPYNPNPPANGAHAAESHGGGPSRAASSSAASSASSAPSALSGGKKSSGDEERALNSGELIGMAISDLGQKIKRAFSPPAAVGKGERVESEGSGGGFRTKDPAASRSAVPGVRKKPVARASGSEKPVPWVPRTATGSPINGPALPGMPPPVSGDPFRSPLAKAGLLDLIGRAQEKYLPKGKGKAPSERRVVEGRVAGKARPKPGRPEACEGVVSLEKVGFSATPRVIGPRPKAEELVGGEERVVGSGVRRMDGKAILAAILRSSDAGVRGAVERDDPELFRELRGRMFYFDDLIYTEPGALARVFTAAPVERAALALKFAAPKLRERVLGAVSPGRARALCETPQRAGMDDVEAAQKEVLGVALKLQAAGRILIDPRDPDLAG